MVERDGPLSLSRQCELLAVGRSSLYREPASESAANLELMRRIDELYMDCPFYGSRRMSMHLRREGVVAGRHRARRLMGVDAVYPKPRVRRAPGVSGDAADLFVPTASSSNGALTGLPKERLMHIARHELAAVRDRVANSGVSVCCSMWTTPTAVGVRCA